MSTLPLGLNAVAVVAHPGYIVIAGEAVPLLATGPGYPFSGTLYGIDLQGLRPHRL